MRAAYASSTSSVSRAAFALAAFVALTQAACDADTRVSDRPDPGYGDDAGRDATIGSQDGGKDGAMTMRDGGGGGGGSDAGDSGADAMPGDGGTECEPVARARIIASLLATRLGLRLPRFAELSVHAPA